VFKFLGGTYRSTYRPLNDAIIAGRLRGAAGVIGCSNPNVEFEEGHLGIVKELLANDVLVVSTGCNSITCAKHGLMTPEAAFQHAGKGLQEICRAVGIPPVLHMGSCVDNSRILRVLTNIVAEGGLGTTCRTCSWPGPRRSGCRRRRCASASTSWLRGPIP
jgi:carbon-monoxide dehydrogenase catalytic subunit